jgi:Hypoxia induced protein conserved region
MRAILVFLMGLAMLGVVGVLLAGVVGTARGMDPRRSNQLMRWRVLLQGTALLLLALLLALAGR